MTFTHGWWANHFCQVEKLGIENQALYRCSIDRPGLKFAGGLFENIDQASHWTEAPTDLRRLFKNKRKRLFKFVGFQQTDTTWLDAAIVICTVRLTKCDGHQLYYELDKDDYQYVQNELKDAAARA